MSNMRQYYKRWQFLLLWNAMAVLFLLISGKLNFSFSGLFDLVVVLLAVNVASLIGGRKYKDWKK